MNGRDALVEEARLKLAAHANLAPEQVTPDKEVADLGLDSIDIAEFGEKWREAHDIELDVDDVLNVTTVWDVVEAVTSKVDADAPAAP